MLIEERSILGWDVERGVPVVKQHFEDCSLQWWVVDKLADHLLANLVFQVQQDSVLNGSSNVFDA